VRLDHVTPADLGLGGHGLLAAAIEHLERDPADDDKAPLAGLSPRELQLVLVYFAQEGRDAYCALEVFDWLRRADRVDGETMELMAAIACAWIERLVGAGGDVADVSALLGEMDCVGLRPGFSLVEKAVALYWDRCERARAVEFVRDVLRRGAVGAGPDYDGERGGPVGYLAWKMMVINLTASISLLQVLPMPRCACSFLPFMRLIAHASLDCPCVSCFLQVRTPAENQLRFLWLWILT
jgi:hypothetical protein